MKREGGKRVPSAGCSADSLPGPEVGDRDKEQTEQASGGQSSRSVGLRPKLTKDWKTEAGATRDTGKRVLDKYKETPLL